jgi:hypothetical protein
MDVDDDDCDELSSDREREENCTGGKGTSWPGFACFGEPRRS